MTSRRMRDGFSAPHSRKPSAPSEAVTTSYPSCLRVYWRSRWTFGSSSTTRILAAISGCGASLWGAARGDGWGRAEDRRTTLCSERSPNVRSDPPPNGSPRRGGASVGAHSAAQVAGDRLEETGELGRDDELRRRTGAERLEGLQVLERHRLLVDPGRRPEDPRQGLAEALGAE